ncbi:MAG: hypothetical protein EOO38_30895 [Cytophagaceae bacterium]|nr:MAG: hypothetical protein EOO38_30895 [Cytophagaceae bacterium]
MEDEFFDERMEWIREQLDDPEAEEDHPRWDELSEEFDNLYGSSRDYDDDWEIPGRTRLDLFEEAMEAVLVLLGTEVSYPVRQNLRVMLHGHVIAATEGFLASSFIGTTLTSEFYIKALVETDPTFAKTQFSMKEIFAKKAGLRNEIGTYLQEVIYHNVFKVKLMYKAVLKIDLGELAWLATAVATRHDCVHRAGYTKEGIEVYLPEQSIKELVEKCRALVRKVDSQIQTLPKLDDLEPLF